jgi:uncharacterized protein (DUF1330 family)
VEHILPTKERFDELAAMHRGSVVMVNLLKFRKTTTSGRTGAEAYKRYAANVNKLIEARGGRIVWAGKPVGVLVGTSGDNWDAVLLAQYPSLRTLQEMLNSEEYLAIHKDREEALERTALIMSTEGL